MGITTGLYGAGGFGKTTLARVVCADGRVRRRFGGGVFLVTVGRDVRGPAAVAAKVNDVIKLVAGEEATFTDPELAGRRLGALLDAGPRRLLVVDDVWEAGQLAPFAAAGRRCARLVTTRVPGLLGGRDVAVRVDQMSAGQARRLLTAGLPPLDPVVADGLLAVTGRWPLLLRLVNKILANAAGTGADAGAAGTQLLERLRAGGPAVVDDLLGEDSRGLDVGQPGERAQAVRATIEAEHQPAGIRRTRSGSPSWGCSPKTRQFRLRWLPGYGGPRPGWMSCSPRSCAPGWPSWRWCRPPAGPGRAGWRCMMWCATSCAASSGRGSWRG